ncbi:MAG: PAS domain S-box protein [Bacteroidales bacterium]
MNREVKDYDLDLYLQILNKLANPIFVKDDQHVFVMVNEAFCNLFKLEPDDFIGKSDAEIFPEQEWKVFHKKDLKILNTGESDENEEDVTIPGGKKLRVVTMKSLLTSLSGKKFVLGIITDITEKTALIAKIRESRTKYKTIFNLGSDPSGLVAYPEWLTHEVNDASLDIAGLSRRNLIGKTADHIFSWVDPEEKAIYFRTLERKKVVQNMDIRLRNYKGEVLSFLASSKIMKLHDKSFLLYSMRDITDLKRTEATLKDSRMMYREMVEYSPIPMFIHRLGVILFANDAAISFSGESRDRVIGQRIQEVIRIPIAAGEDTNLDFLFNQPSHTWEARDVLLETKEGVPRNFILRNVRIKYAGDLATMTKILDIAEQGNLEQYVLNKIIEAEENERKRFAADLHDDIGPLLSTIKIHLQLLERSVESEKREEMIRMLELRINEVIQKVHQISHSISPHTIADFGLEGAVSEFCRRINNMEVYTISFEHNISGMRFPEDIELHYYRIILELLNNSMKYSQAKEMSVSLKYQNGSLRLRYYDHGQGYHLQEVLNKSATLGIKNIIHRASLMSAEIRFRRVRKRTIVLISTPVSPR